MAELKICVLGLWHLGTVTAACLASVGHRVVGLDFDSQVVSQLSKGCPPVFEPGLEALTRQGIEEGRLSFTVDPGQAVQGIDVLWTAYDTPVDDDDHADVQSVLDRIELVLPYLPPRTLILISSQLPAGTTRKLEAKHQSLCAERELTFAYSPENLRLGKAIAAFTKADRVIVGLRSERDRPVLDKILRPFTERIEWMSVESAEMTKHALNAFLATSVSFINEIAVICEHAGADAREVERGLKSESRIGPKAYLSPGAAFAGGTLARDISYLVEIAGENDVRSPLLRGVRESNDYHRQWAQRKMAALMTDLREKTIAVWGLTYKPGTDTLRRSSAIEFCEWLYDKGARVRAHDPAVKVLPATLAAKMKLCESPLDALNEADALVIATEWPDYATVDVDSILSRMHSPLVLDAGRFLARQLDSNPGVRYITVGKS